MMMGQRMGTVPIFTVALILSPIWGYLGFSIWSWVVHFTGKWLKGQGTFKEVRFAYAWSCFPLIVNVVLWFFLAAFYGRSLFANFSPESQVLSHSEVGILFLILLLRITAAVWSLVIYLNVLAEVRQYSVLRAIGNVIIAGLIIAIAFYLIVWVGYSTFGAALPNLSAYLLKS